MVEIGEKAPEFRLADQDDQLVSLGNYVGEWLVLYFYPKDDTPGCTKEACDFTDGLPDFSALNAKIVGVSVDDPESHRRFIAKHKLGIRLLSDPDKTAHKAYGAWGLKKNYGKEYEGTIRSTFVISPDGTVAAKWRNVQVRSKRKSGEVRHADQVRGKLAALQTQD